MGFIGYINKWVKFMAVLAVAAVLAGSFGFTVAAANNPLNDDAAAVVSTSVSSCKNGDISPAIAVFRKNAALYKCGLMGELVCFTRSDYENTVGAELNYITFTSLPDPEEGILKYNGAAVLSGQSVASPSLNYLTFTPVGEQPFKAGFTFRCGEKGWEEVDIPCFVAVSRTRNMSPVLGEGSFSTSGGAKSEYRLNVFEPDGDIVSFSVEKYPAHGSLAFAGENIIYTPKPGFYGGDSFEIKARDEYGNASLTAKISVSVEKSDIVFADMSSSPAHAAAIALAKRDIVTYDFKGGEYLYYPDTKVSRIDFLVMLMAAADVSPSENAGSGMFNDVSTLTEGRRKYLAKASALGFAGSGGAFRPADCVTKSEAALWAAKLLGLDGRGRDLRDLGSLDAETAAGVYAAVEAGIMDVADGCFNPGMEIDREEAARILARVMSR